MQKRKSFLLTFVKVSEKIDEASKGLKSGVTWTREIAECVWCDWGYENTPMGAGVVGEGNVFWWSISDSNRSPFDCQSNALPDELIPHCGCKYINFFTMWQIQYYSIARRMGRRVLIRFSSRSRRSILAPSDLACEGSGCVSRKRPSAPTAIDALAIVDIISGRPPVTPEL